MTDDQSGSYKIDANLDQPIDWAEAMAELEREAPPDSKPAAPKPTASKPTPVPAATPRPIATPKPVAKAPAPEPDPKTPHDDLAEIMTAVNTAMNALKKFEDAHPYLIAPNIYRSWDESLRESSLVLAREFRRLRGDDNEPAADDESDEAPLPPADAKG